ncbi:site-specific integrase, partial [bacterium]|nr:site-specific integrase [bacterium]
HFEELPELFTNNRGYRPSATTFIPEDVEKIFAVASKKENLSIIPYLTFLFFSGVRPQEMADPNKKERRFGWKNMLNWKVPSTVTGGISFQIKVFVDGIRMSKGSKDRIADLSENGLRWMEWWVKEEGKSNLPTTGKIPFSNRVLKRVKAESGLGWSPDIARHTFTSHAHYNTNFIKCGEDYWLQVCDHSKEIWKRHYAAPKLQEDCDKYFNILPPNSSNEEKQTVDHVKLLKAS